MPEVVRFHQLGGPENLIFEDLPTAEPAAGEAKMRIHAVGMNRAESMYYHGYYIEQPILPSRLGYEAVGVVEAVGEGVDKSWIGKQVATVPGFSQNKYGLLGEEAIVPASALAEYPHNLSAEEGAGIWMQYLTAWGALVHFGKVAPGDFVLITAASSSVGLAAIQIVKDAGGIAIATTRGSSKRDTLLKLGADHVIATEEEDLVARVKEITGGKGARIIFDPVAGPWVETLAKAVAYQGIIFEYGILSLEPTPFPLLEALPRGITVRGYIITEISGDPTVFTHGKKYIYDRLADGRFKPVIDKVFPFEQTIEAYRYLESNQQIGKVILKVK
jgi:NADPH:quinone reductase-like Zn-dependent oxidoreductase